MPKQNPSKPNETKRPDYVVYTVREVEGKEPFWTAIGGAWKHKSGDGYQIRLVALPIDDTLVLLPPKESADKND